MTDRSILCYAYDANYHCIECARYAFSSDQANGIDPGDALDGEGNPVHPVFTWDEWQQLDGETETLGCSDCHRVIETYSPTN